MNTATAAPTVRQAQVELIALSECIHATRGASLPASYELARLQRPELAALLDAHGVAQPRQTLLTERSKPKSAHEQLVALAEEYRSINPGVTKEGAYAAVWEANAKVVAELAEQQHAEARSLNLAEQQRIGKVFAAEGPGQQRGYNASSQHPLTQTIPGDVAADPRHAGWSIEPVSC